MSQQKKRRKPPAERPYVSDLELHDALEEKLTTRELMALERQIRRAVEIATDKAVRVAIEETFTRNWAVVVRVLRDRFGWGQQRLLKLWNSCLEYLEDIEAGRITTQEMLSVIERDDDIRIKFNTDK